MTVASTKHRKVSALADEPDTTLVRPSDWNADHDLWDGTRTISATTDIVSNADHRSLLICTSASAPIVTIPAPAGSNMPLGWKTRIRRAPGTTSMTINGSGGALFNGVASWPVAAGETVEVFARGSVDYAVSPGGLGAGTVFTLSVSDAPPPTTIATGSMWWNSATGQLYVLYDDGDSKQWVTAAVAAIPDILVNPAPFDALAYNGMQINGSCEVSQERGSTGSGVSAGVLPYIQDGWRMYYTSSPMAMNAWPQTATTISGLPLSFQVEITTAKPALAAGDRFFIDHVIEGYPVSRLGFGTAGAAPISIGFYVRAYRTGIMTVALMNSTAARVYMTNVVINSANTWEYKTITVPGDTAGTWAKDNTVGMIVRFVFASGTTFQGTPGIWTANCEGTAATTNFAAATGSIYITGLIVLPGIAVPTASQLPLIMRPYDQELLTCQRYFSWASINAYFDSQSAGGALSVPIFYPTKRALPTLGAPVVDPTVSGAAIGNVLSGTGNLTRISISGCSYDLGSLTTGSTYVVGYRSSVDARL